MPTLSGAHRHGSFRGSERLNGCDSGLALSKLRGMRRLETREAHVVEPRDTCQHEEDFTHTLIDLLCEGLHQ